MFEMFHCHGCCEKLVWLQFFVSKINFLLCCIKQILSSINKVICFLLLFNDTSMSTKDKIMFAKQEREKKVNFPANI